MRKADYDVAWKKCRNINGHRIWLNQIKAQHHDISVSSLMSAIIGPNGAGKTGFLKALSSLLSGDTTPHPRHQLLSIHGKYSGRDFSITHGSAVDFDTEYIDASLDSHYIQNYLARQPDIDDLVQQAGIRTLSEGDMDLYRHVCKRNYSSISISEIEAPAPATLAEEDEGDDTVFPFFSVELDGIKYDSLSMGFGELCAFYIIWKTNRANRGTILLFDEPDSHLSPASRRALLDVLAFLADSRDLLVLFSSHAVESLHVMEESEMHIIHSHGVSSPPHIAPVNTKRNVIRALGLTQIRRLLLVVEDVDAKEAVQQILNRWGNDIASSVDIQVVGGGAAEVIRFVRLFPPNASICRVVAVLDGDKKTEHSEAGVLFLPTNHDPVHAARSSVVSDAQQLATLLGVDYETLKLSLKNIAHINHHDFCAGLKDELKLEGIEVSRVRAALIHAWLDTPDISVAGQSLAGQLSQYVDSIPLNM